MQTSMAHLKIQDTLLVAGPPFGVPKSQVQAVVKTGFPGAADTSPTPNTGRDHSWFSVLAPGPSTGEQKQK